MKKTLLWLDDRRNPFDTQVDWLIFSPIGRDVDVVWVQYVGVHRQKRFAGRHLF